MKQFNTSIFITLLSVLIGLLLTVPAQASPSYQPDIKVRPAGVSTYLGENIYNTDGAGQTKSAVVIPGTAMTYYAQIENDGNTADIFYVKGTSIPSGWTVKYFTPTGIDVSVQVTFNTSGWSTGTLAPAAHTYLRITVQPGTSITPGTEFPLLLTASAKTDTSYKDAVKANTIVRKLQPDAKIRLANDSAYLGENIYEAYTQHQTREVYTIYAVTCYVQVQNDGNVSDSFTVTGSVIATGWAARFYTPAGTEVTDQVTDPNVGWTTGPLSPQGSTYLRVTIKPTAAFSEDMLCMLTMTAKSVTAPTQLDVVKAMVGYRLPGQEKINLTDGAVMVWVPGGTFTMGSGVGVGNSDEQPAHQVTLSGYWMYKYEVTVSQYLAFCQATGRAWPAYPISFSWEGKSGWDDPALANHPIVNVTWNDVKAYADWAGVVLPTEAQWEYASRGSDDRNFPWGGIATPTDPYNGWNVDYCANRLNSSKVGISTWPVGSFPAGASWCKAMDLAGNVQEWCADWYGAYSADSVTDPLGPATGTSHIYRGGAWANYYGADHYIDDCRGARRLSYQAVVYYSFIGFRCAAAD